MASFDVHLNDQIWFHQGFIKSLLSHLIKRFLTNMISRLQISVRMFLELFKQFLRGNCKYMMKDEEAIHELPNNPNKYVLSGSSWITWTSSK